MASSRNALSEIRFEPNPLGNYLVVVLDQVQLVVKPVRSDVPRVPAE